MEHNIILDFLNSIFLQIPGLNRGPLGSENLLVKGMIASALIAIIAIAVLVILRFLIPVIIVGIIIAILLILIFGGIPIPVHLLDY